MALATQEKSSIPTVALTASANLPAAGAYESVPALSAMVPIHVRGRRATITVSYTRGTSGGQAAHKVYTHDGTTVAQVLGADGTYAGTSGPVSTGAGAISYTITVDLTGGEVGIGIASAEVGVTATPGSYSSSITFGG